MHDIDFLPAQYTQRRSRRQTHPWRVFVVLAFVALVAVAAVAQRGRRQSLEADLAAVEPAYELAMQQNRQLGAVQAKLQRLRGLAALYAYLQHPWPRTQLLVGVLEPLPEDVTFERVQIVREKPPAPVNGERQVRGENLPEEEQLAKLPPPERDLKRTRNVCDNMRTVIHLAGTTTDSASLHRYLGELGKNGLFVKAELNSLESVANNAKPLMRFQATVLVRPGYGQPGGPTSVPQPKRDGRLAARRTQLPLRLLWADQKVDPTMMSTLP
jgi:Tfp pilus assembly protein PilN